MKYTMEEWVAEGKRRFGENIKDWKFVCPACGRINTGREFCELGAKTNDIYQTCIGRHNGKGISGAGHKSGERAPEHGCDWSAFGLFGTLGKGDIVTEIDGSMLNIFAFAESAGSSDKGGIDDDNSQQSQN